MKSVKIIDSIEEKSTRICVWSIWEYLGPSFGVLCGPSPQTIESLPNVVSNNCKGLRNDPLFLSRYVMFCDDSSYSHHHWMLSCLSCNQTVPWTNPQVCLVVVCCIMYSNMFPIGKIQLQTSISLSYMLYPSYIHFELIPTKFDWAFPMVQPSNFSSFGRHRPGPWRSGSAETRRALPDPRRGRWRGTGGDPIRAARGSRGIEVTC